MADDTKQVTKLKADLAEATARADAAEGKILTASRDALAPIAGDDVIDANIVITAVHVPGSAIVREGDGEPQATTQDRDPVAPLPVEYETPVDTRDQDLNYLTRSNIVPQDW